MAFSNEGGWGNKSSKSVEDVFIRAYFGMSLWKAILLRMGLFIVLILILFLLFSGKS